MADDVELKIRIRAELGQIRQQLDALNDDLKQTGDSANKSTRGVINLDNALDGVSSGANKAKTSISAVGSEAEKIGDILDDAGQELEISGEDVRDGFDGVDLSISRAALALAGFFTLYSAIAALRGVARVTDEYATLNAQLKLTTNSQEEFLIAQDETLRIAQTTRQPIATVASAYAILQRSTEKLGKSQKDIVGVLETVNKAIALTPVSAEVAASTLTQFGQAMAGDFKNGAQELNSIMEQTPGLAIAIADGLGVATSDLKQMGEDGELSAGLIFAALQRVAQQVDEDFTKIPRTVGGALTQLQNDVIVTFGKIDTSGLQNSIDGFSDTLTDPAIAEGLSLIAGGLVSIAGLIVEAVGLFGALGKEIGFAAARVSGLTDEMDLLLREKAQLDSALSNKSFFNVKNITNTEQENKDRLKVVEAEIALEKFKRDPTGFIKEEKEKKAKEAQAEQLKTPEGKEQLKKEGDEALEKERKRAADKKAEEALKKEKEANAERLVELEAQLKKENELFEKSARFRAEFEARALGADDKEVKAIGDLAEEGERLERAKKARDDAAREAERQKAEDKKNNEEKAREAKKLAEELEKINIEFEQKKGNTEEARRLQLNARFDETKAQLKREGNETGVDLINDLIRLDLADVKLAELKKKIADALKTLADKEQSVDARVTTGALTPQQGEQEINEARTDATSELQGYGAQLAVLKDENIPGAAEELDKLNLKFQDLDSQGVSGSKRAIANLNAEFDSFKENLAANVASSAVDNLANSLLSIADGSKSAGDGMKDFARNFAQSVAQMIARAIALQAVLAVLNLIPGGAAVATLIAPAKKVKAGVNHQGGIAGGGGTIRQVPSFIFAAAPRYHSGGIVGMKPGEIPAVLQRGEEVLTQNDPRHIANQKGGQDSGGVRIINTIDPNMVADYMSSSAGEKTFLNVIQRNRGMVKQVLL